MNEDKILGDLISFIRKEMNEFKGPINRGTLIEDDLGITGDEAAELIMNFSKKYNVDIHEFVFSNYFYDESAVFILSHEVKLPFNVGHLQKAIIAGRLDETVINNQEL